MQATSTIEPASRGVPASISDARSRSFTRAFDDIRSGIANRQLWSHLGWQDIKQRYRRSVLGPLWITMSMAVTAIGLGLLYSQLLGANIGTFLPYVTVGFVVWAFIIGCLTEGTDTFIHNEGLIKHLPAPLTVYGLRTVWRLALMFAHNLLVYLVVVTIFWGDLTPDDHYTITDGGIHQPGIDWSILLAIPGALVLAINGVWVTLLFGIVSTRFRDVPQVIAALSSLMFFMTPIVWSADILQERVGDSVGNKSLIIDLNPLYHYIEIIRAPLLGLQQSWTHWVVVGGFTVVGWALTLLVMRNYRARVSYWV